MKVSWYLLVRSYLQKFAAFFSAFLICDLPELKLAPGVLLQVILDENKSLEMVLNLQRSHSKCIVQ